MATVFDNLLSSDTYAIADAVNKLKSQYVDEDEQTLSMGIYGYIGALETAKMQMNVQMASELSNEVFPNRAKYDRNVITHAILYGVDDIYAAPASLTAIICIKQSDLEKYSVNDKFIIDRHSSIFIQDTTEDTDNRQYEFHPYYDIILSKVTINNNESVYTARYDNSITNNLSPISNPYLNAPMTMQYGGETYIGVQVQLYQVTLTTVEKKIITSNLIDNKTFIFTHEDQLADFIVEVVDGDKVTELTPIYEGGVAPANKKFCYYILLDDTRVRVKFERTSYMPSLNSDIKVHMQTTKAYNGNFPYKRDAVFATLSSDEYGYKEVQSMVWIQTDSENGLDAKSADDLKAIIPKEALARGAITTEMDLNNYFNQLNTDDNKLLLGRKVDNQIEHTYYSHLLMKDEENNIIPTNTIRLMARVCDMPVNSNGRFVIPAGAIIKYDADLQYGVLIHTDIDENNIEDFIEDEVFDDNSEYTGKEASTFSMAADDPDLDPELKAINDEAVKNIAALKATDITSDDAETRLEEGVEDYTLTTEAVDENNPPTQESSGENYDTIVMADGVDGDEGTGSAATLTSDDSVVKNPTYKVVDSMADVVPVTDENVLDFMYLVTDENPFTIDPNNHKLFYYTNPYTIVVNANTRQYAAYYLCVVDESKYMNYKYINQNSDIQFICNYIDWYRKFITDNNKYKLDITVSQNIQQDMGLYEETKVTDEYGNEKVIVTKQKVKVIAVLYKNGAAYRYLEAKFISFSDDTYSFNFQFVFETKNVILDTLNNIRIENLGICGQDGYDYGYFADNTAMNIYVLVQDGGGAGRYDLDQYVSGLNDYSVTNMFEVNEGVDFFVNYSGIMSSKLQILDADDTMDQQYMITSLPVVGYQYALNESRMDYFVNQLNYKKAYIDNANNKIWNPFGIDFKFFNTYGPSRLFTLDNYQLTINRTNIQLNFRVKLSSSYDTNTVNLIKKYIKSDVIENLNGEDSLHIPNLITNVTNKFRESLVFFEFLGIDNYGPGVQHLYHSDEDYVDLVPEFINVNMIYNEDGTKTPDINIEVV